jgi:hypothetical protein
MSLCCLYQCHPFPAECTDGSWWAAVWIKLGGDVSVDERRCYQTGGLRVIYPVIFHQPRLLHSHPCWSILFPLRKKGLAGIKCVECLVPLSHDAVILLPGMYPYGIRTNQTLLFSLADNYLSSNGIALMLVSLRHVDDYQAGCLEMSDKRYAIRPWSKMRQLNETSVTWNVCALLGKVARCNRL